MKALMPIIVGIAVGLSYVSGDHFIVGNVTNELDLATREIVEYNLIPFTVREKKFSYTGPDDEIIKGIKAIDTYLSKSTIRITDGGIGSSFVYLMMTSGRGSGMRYDIRIYVDRSKL